MTPADDYDRPEGPRSNGIATASLVVGVISLCIGPLAGIPAIVLGAMGISRARQGVGHGTAVAGLVLGIVSTVVTPAILIALLLPAVQKVREAAARTHDMNGFKQTGLAVMNHEATNRRLTTAYTLGPDGEPNRGLSWRVAMLPYLEEEPLYRQFRLDEAWDGPTNRPTAQKYLKVYGSATDPQDNLTRIRVFVGPGTLFEDSPEWREKATLGRITDGTSQTLLAIESADRVPWASPKELPYQPGGPLPALGHPGRNTVIVMMADGSVRTLNKSISPTVLHALITREGGETLPPNWDQ